VLFRVRKYADYGALSGRSVDDMIAGARVEVAPYKEDPMDFVLWKPSTDELPGWDSPWGRGRPGWHIECSAMAHELLGAHFDIHGGGNDLMFPHHENEIAQSCCAHPGSGFANVWMHNEMLQVEGKKMSKSLGNFFTVRDLLEQGVPGEVIRFVMLSTHYRKPMDWTIEKAVAAESKLHGFLELIANHGDLEKAKKIQPIDAMIDALSDDLNTHVALEILSKMNGSADADQLVAHLVFLGFYSWEGLAAEVAERQEIKNRLLKIAERLSNLRKEAMETKDFSSVDALKSELESIGLSVQISKEGVYLRPDTEFKISKLEALK
jgi:cysteinyl-tRNA synthetase